ncbi:hypothetical protein JAAARDRAFT_197159 [Jaapia argillacea MUCL 33604]|uniref:F-box domain-containing protein n=1 Tax=Jaapia argillacea MUCL 33604 TaxID=933084 RepID=A0A067PQW3_9AGAM|nr:hypothetical protein JAAARDRAFT_197159 [Jaapia argillacea MUCL 33604]
MSGLTRAAIWPGSSIGSPPSAMPSSTPGASGSGSGEGSSSNPPPSASENIPIEIWSHIFSSLSSSPSTLHSLSLVSRQCHSIAQPILIRNLIWNDPVAVARNIPYWPPGPTGTNQNQIGDPTLIRSLIFSLSPNRTSSPPNITLPNAQHPNAALAHETPTRPRFSDPLLVSLRSRISHLHTHLHDHDTDTITAIRRRMARRDLEMREYSVHDYLAFREPELVADSNLYSAAFNQLARFTNLDTLVFRNMGLPPNLFEVVHSLPNLERLHIQACLLSPAPGGAGALAYLDHSTLGLRELTLWGLGNLGYGDNVQVLLLATASGLRTLRVDSTADVFGMWVSLGGHVPLQPQPQPPIVPIQGLAHPMLPHMALNPAPVPVPAAPNQNPAPLAPSPTLTLYPHPTRIPRTLAHVSMRMPPLPYDKLLNSSKRFLHSFFDFLKWLPREVELERLEMSAPVRPPYDLPGGCIPRLKFFRGPLNAVLAVLGGGASGLGEGEQGAGGEGEGEVEVEIVGSEPEECEDGWHEELERADTFGMGHHHHGHGFGVAPGGGGGGGGGFQWHAGGNKSVRASDVTLVLGALPTPHRVTRLSVRIRELTWDDELLHCVGWVFGPALRALEIAWGVGEVRDDTLVTLGAEHLTRLPNLQSVQLYRISSGPHKRKSNRPPPGLFHRFHDSDDDDSDDEDHGHGQRQVMDDEYVREASNYLNQAVDEAPQNSSGEEEAEDGWEVARRVPVSSRRQRERNLWVGARGRGEGRYVNRERRRVRRGLLGGGMRGGGRGRVGLGGGIGPHTMIPADIGTHTTTLEEQPATGVRRLGRIAVQTREQRPEIHSLLSPQERAVEDQDLRVERLAAQLRSAEAEFNAAYAAMQSRSDVLHDRGLDRNVPAGYTEEEARLMAEFQIHRTRFHEVVRRKEERERAHREAVDELRAMRAAVDVSEGRGGDRSDDDDMEEGPFGPFFGSRGDRFGMEDEDGEDGFGAADGFGYGFFDPGRQRASGVLGRTTVGDAGDGTRPARASPTISDLERETSFGRRADYQMRPGNGLDPRNPGSWQPVPVVGSPVLEDVVPASEAPAPELEGEDEDERIARDYQMRVGNGLDPGSWRSALVPEPLVAEEENTSSRTVNEERRLSEGSKGKGKQRAEEEVEEPKVKVGEQEGEVDAEGLDFLQQISERWALEQTSIEEQEMLERLAREEKVREEREKEEQREREFLLTWERFVPGLREARLSEGWVWRRDGVRGRANGSGSASGSGSGSSSGSLSRGESLDGTGMNGVLGESVGEGSNKSKRKGKGKAKEDGKVQGRKMNEWARREWLDE